MAALFTAIIRFDNGIYLCVNNKSSQGLLDCLDHRECSGNNFVFPFENSYCGL